MYCNNDPVNRLDPLGMASYKNSYTHKGNGIYNIITIITVLGKKLTYRYEIKKGAIKFNFDKNSYWSVLWRKTNITLATAIYKVAKKN